jgi:Protein of unknown function (DUF4231)
MSEGDREIPLEGGFTTAPGTQEISKQQNLSYRDQLKQEFNRLIDLVDVSPMQKEFLRSRWLDQVLWMESRAASARNWHRRLRLVTIIGGVIIPAFVSLSSFNLDALQQVGQPNQAAVNLNNQYRVFFGVSAFVLSQVVAISAASEQFFNNGDRWRHYRRSVESLKTQGWQFFQLSGPYATYSKTGSHKDAFTLFASQVEEVLQRDVEIYSTQVVQEKKKDEDADSNHDSSN